MSTRLVFLDVNSCLTCLPFFPQHPSIQVNVEVRKEADVYSDMVVLPFIDRYDLVVLKTIAICEFGVRNF